MLLWKAIWMIHPPFVEEWEELICVIFSWYCCLCDLQNAMSLSRSVEFSCFSRKYCWLRFHAEILQSFSTRTRTRTWDASGYDWGNRVFPHKCLASSIPNECRGLGHRGSLLCKRCDTTVWRSEILIMPIYIDLVRAMSRDTLREHDATRMVRYEFPIHSTPMITLSLALSHLW